MPDMTIYLTFIAAALAMQLTPGPDMALVIGRGVGQGRKVAIWTAIGTTAAACRAIRSLSPGRSAVR